MLVRLVPSREPNGIAEGRGDEQRIHRARGRLPAGQPVPVAIERSSAPIP